jgi:hypothetical protein
MRKTCSISGYTLLAQSSAANLPRKNQELQFSDHPSRNHFFKENLVGQERPLRQYHAFDPSNKSSRHMTFLLSALHFKTLLFLTVALSSLLPYDLLLQFHAAASSPLTVGFPKHLSPTASDKCL